MVDLNISLSDAAKVRLAVLQQQKPDACLRFWLKRGGCSAFEYCLDWAEQRQDTDLALPFSTGVLWVDAEDYQLALQGLCIDFEEDVLSSAFVFRNPNEAGGCGCGKSFSIKEA